MTNRTSATRNAFIDAFGDLLLRRHRRPQVIDLVRRARLSRSTFYQHFDDIADVRAQSYARPLGILARASLAGDKAALEPLLVHFAENAARACDLLSGAERAALAMGLSALYEAWLVDQPPRSAVPSSYLAHLLAEAQLGLVGCWLEDGAAAPIPVVAGELCRTARMVLTGREADERQNR